MISKDCLFPVGRVRSLATVIVLISTGFAANAQSPLLGGGSAAAGQTKAAVCAACHGADGNSVNPIWPSLAGQHTRYIVNQLNAYKTGERIDPGMRGFAATLSDGDMLDVAAYFASQHTTPRGADPAQISLGEQIYQGGVPERGVPACIACHGPTGNGNPLAAFPRVSNQHAAYLATTLRAYAAGERTSDAQLNQMMRDVAESLQDDEIEALASYMQGLQ